jgi:hypothetical protein
MFMIPQVYQPGAPQPGADFAPPADDVERMTKYNEELAKAGALIALDGLHPLQQGARVSFKGGKPTVTDGPFIEAKEVVGGYWMIDVKSKQEALEWARKVPAADGDVIEIRQIFMNSEFPEDVQKASESEVVRKELEKRAGK